MTTENQKTKEFEEIALPHAAALLRTALRLMPQPQMAEDLVQEALLAAWRSFHQFRPGTDCKAWLFRIMLNLSAKKRLSFGRESSGVDVSKFDSGPAVRNRHNERWELLQALGRLPIEQAARRRGRMPALTLPRVRER